MNNLRNYIHSMKISNTLKLLILLIVLILLSICLSSCRTKQIIIKEEVEKLDTVVVRDSVMIPPDTVKLEITDKIDSLLRINDNLIGNLLSKTKDNFELNSEIIALKENNEHINRLVKDLEKELRKPTIIRFDKSYITKVINSKIVSNYERPLFKRLLLLIGTITPIILIIYLLIKLIKKHG